jgi:L-aminopeptidase/D-esterase-like protein
MHNAITDVPGVRVGHWTNMEAATGCTVILCPQGAVAGVNVGGGAPGTRELALLDPTCLVDRAHAVLLTGGSAYGLAAADGVMRWLEEHGHGFDVGVAKVPIVPAAVIFDLALGRADVRPDAAAGYAACAAATDGPVAQGNVGVGTGATVGKAFGFTQASKGGVGVASRRIGRGIVVGALAAVNAFGDIIDPTSQRIIAGARRPLVGGFAGSQAYLESALGQVVRNQWGRSTVLAAVATNVALTKAQATRVAMMAHDGLARTVRPAHTLLDGDITFALSLGDVMGDVSLVGAVAADVVADAILAGVRAAQTLHGLPAAE